MVKIWVVKVLIILIVHLFFLKKGRDGNVMLEKAKWNHNEHKSYLNEIKKGKNKYNEQKSALYNIKTLYKAQNSVIKFFDYKASLESETNLKQFTEKDSKITNSNYTS